MVVSGIPDGEQGAVESSRNARLGIIAMPATITSISPWLSTL
jgi:hypothetical protein